MDDRPALRMFENIDGNATFFPFSFSFIEESFAIVRIVLPVAAKDERNNLVLKVENMIRFAIFAYSVSMYGTGIFSVDMFHV